MSSAGMGAAETSRDETHCAGPHCRRPLPRAGVAGGRPPQFCSQACRQAAYRTRVAERMKAANDAHALVDELRRRGGPGLAGLSGVLLAEPEQGGGHLGATAAPAAEVDRLARGEAGNLSPAAKTGDGTPHTVTKPVPTPAEPQAQILRTVSLESEGFPGWRLAQDAEGRIWHHWQLQLDELTVGVVSRRSKVSGRVIGWEVQLHSCPSPRGPWDTRALATLQGIDAHLRHLQRERKRRGGRPRS